MQREAGVDQCDEPPPPPSSSAAEQVRKTVVPADYTVSCRATNPALVIHPVPCTDLLTNGKMPVTHFPVAFLPVSFPASAAAHFNTPKKPTTHKTKKRSHLNSQTDDVLVQCFLTTQTHAVLHVRGRVSIQGGFIIT